MAARAETFSINGLCHQLLDIRQPIRDAERRGAAPAEMLVVLNNSNTTVQGVIQQLRTSHVIPTNAAQAKRQGDWEDRLVTRSMQIQTRLQVLQTHFKPFTPPRWSWSAVPAIVQAAPGSSATTAEPFPATRVAVAEPASSPVIERVHRCGIHANGFECAVFAPQFNLERVQREYELLRREQRVHIDEVVRVIARRPILPFSARHIMVEGVNRSRKVLQTAVEILQVQRRLAEFVGKISSLDVWTAKPKKLAKAIKLHYDSLVLNSDDGIGITAQRSLIHTCALMRGMAASANQESENRYAARVLSNYFFTKYAARDLAGMLRSQLQKSIGC